MKKRVISVISLLMSSTVLFACNATATGTNMFEYEELELKDGLSLKMDENFIIDGKNENEYDGLRSYSFTETKSGICLYICKRSKYLCII